MNVKITSRSFAQDLFFNSGLTFKPIRYSKNAKKGGCKSALIRVDGDYRNLQRLLFALRCRMDISDDRADPLWWGFIKSVSVFVGNTKIKTTLDGMYNRLNIAYTKSGVQAASSVSAETGWGDQAASQTEYGIIEKRLRVGGISDDGALAYRQTELNRHGLPQQEVTLESSSQTGYAEIEAWGWFYTLGFRYFSNTNGNAAGVELFDTPTSEDTMPLGFAHTRSGTSYFVGSEKKLYDTVNSLLLGTGNKIVITGTSSNNGLHNTTASYYGGNVTFAETTYDEYSAEFPGSCAYEFVGTKIAQKFSLESNNPFYATEIQIKLQKFGTPTDGVRVSLYSDSAGLPGTQLATGTLAASAISSSAGWHRFELDVEVSISFGTNYWIVVERTGTSSTNYYNVSLDNGLGYPRGNMKVWAIAPASSWLDRSPNADMLFKVIGAVETTTQISNIVTQVGSFIASVDIEDASGKRSSPYRTGEDVAQAIIEDLLAIGTANNRALLCDVDSDRRLILYEEAAKPVNGGASYMIKRDGTIVTKDKTPVRKELCQVGFWADIETLVNEDIGELNQLSPVFVEGAEYSVGQDSLQIITRDRKSVYDIVSLKL